MSYARADLLRVGIPRCELEVRSPANYTIVSVMNSAARLLDRQFDPAKQMPLSRDCIGRMITEGRTCAGKLIVRDLEKAYSGRLIAS